MAARTAAISQRSIRAIANLPRLPRGDGFAVAFLHPETVGGGFGPFLQIDAFALAQPVFKPHPHAGFSAVTYILPESPIGFINRDSLGNRQRIAPGGLHWTAAGSGMLHEEVPERLGIVALGLQMFIDLPLAGKESSPSWMHLEPGKVPRVATAGSDIRVVLGTSQGAASPLAPPTPGVRLIDVTLAPDGNYTELLPASEHAVAYLLAGDALAGRERRRLSPFDLAVTAVDGTELTISAGSAGARLILFGGPSLDQPVVARGPFVMASPAQLQRAIKAYVAGRMGQLGPNRYDATGVPVL